MRLTALVAVAIFASTASAQPRVSTRPLPAGTSALRGTVTDAESNQPIAGCTVRVNPRQGTAGPASIRSSSVVTGDDGVFEFARIAEGNYHFRVECAAYLTAFVPSGESGGPPYPGLTLFKDQQRLNVDFKLTRGATLRGRVVDANGMGVPRAYVRLGGPFLGNSLVVVQNAQTGNDGSFELSKLPEGSWAFEVEIPPSRGASRLPIIYYPGVLKREDAGLIEIITGKVHDDILITIPPVLERTLSVRIPRPDATMTDVNVSVIRGEPLLIRPLDVDADGHAVMRGLTDGRYVVVATAVSGNERWADFQAVDFLETSIDIALQPRPAGNIRGRVITDDGGVPPLIGATIEAVWTESGFLLNPLTAEDGAVAPDGTFEIPGVYGRRLMQLGRFDADWRIHAVMQGRSDITEAGVDVAPGDTAEVTIIVRRR